MKKTVKNLVICVLLLFPFTKIFTQASGNLIAVNAQYNHYILGTISDPEQLDGYIEDWTGAFFEAEFIYKRLTKKYGYQIGVGTSTKIIDIYDYSSNQIIQSRELFLSIPLLLYTRFPITDRLELQFGTGIYAHILAKKDYFAQKTTVPSVYRDSNKKFTKFGIVADMPLYFKMQKNMYLSSGAKIGLDAFPFDISISKYIFMTFYVGVNFAF